MTTTIAPAPASTSAQPAAVARASTRPPVVDDGDGGGNADPRDAARAEMSKRQSDRRLRLVQREAEDGADDADVVDAIVTEGDDTPTADVDPNAPEGDADAEPEETPSWAKKLKDENAAHKAKIAEHEEREQSWTAEVARIKAHHEDISADVAHYKALYESCAKYLSTLRLKDGRPALDPREIELAEQRRQLGLRDRQIKRGGNASSEDGAKKAGAQISERFNAFRTKHPEMDWTKNPDAKAFVTEILAHPIPPYLDRLVAAFVAEQRFKRSQKKPAPTPPPTQRERPQSFTTTGAPSGGAPRRERTSDDGYDRDQIKDDLRAARAGRGR